MIRAYVSGDRVVLVAALPRGSAAYVDRDWLPGASGPLPAVIVGADGGPAWCDGAPVQAPSGIEPDTAAALALLSVARDAAAAVEGLPGRVEVTGNGLIARQLSTLVTDGVRADRRASVVGPPKAIVDVTGDPAVIADATRRLADLGTLVLVGESLGRRVKLNLYPDVHGRGLTLVGVAPPLQQATAHAESEIDDPLLESCRELLVQVRFGAPLPLGGAWYRVSD